MFVGNKQWDVNSIDIFICIYIYIHMNACYYIYIYIYICIYIYRYSTDLICGCLKLAPLINSKSNGENCHSLVDVGISCFQTNPFVHGDSANNVWLDLLGV